MLTSLLFAAAALAIGGTIEAFAARRRRHGWYPVGTRPHRPDDARDHEDVILFQFQIAY